LRADKALREVWIWFNTLIEHVHEQHSEPDSLRKLRKCAGEIKAYLDIALHELEAYHAWRAGADTGCWDPERNGETDA
jgi:hypothetical protein